MPGIKKPRNADAQVDLLRKTPWGTEFRIARTESFGLEVKGDGKWTTACLAHSTSITSSTLRKACLAGTRGSVAEWCADCAKLKDAPKPAAPAKAKPAAATPALVESPASKARSTRKPAAKAKAKA